MTSSYPTTAKLAVTDIEAQAEDTFNADCASIYADLRKLLDKPETTKTIRESLKYALKLVATFDIPVVGEVLMLAVTLVEFTEKLDHMALSMMVLHLQVRIVYKTVATMLWKREELEELREEGVALVKNLKDISTWLDKLQTTHWITRCWNISSDEEQIDVFHKELKAAVDGFKLSLSYPTVLVTAATRHAVAERRKKALLSETEYLSLQQCAASPTQSPPAAASVFGSPLRKLFTDQGASYNWGTKHHRRDLHGQNFQTPSYKGK
ncbi:hypothetical protein EXIGLDRAFT_780632 [Exidia glandulosa HHB12029]|uniref:Uncharacterized protein n=1 Tax=Exidia glandulosa HHB12029 TaxID=1314781 RepID=A0A165BIQ7_EXIGL|nr:hypothetical protein EXIGLDRAFT_780632 [Exidia glandulosa HHB12029]